MPDGHGPGKMPWAMANEYWVLSHASEAVADLPGAFQRNAVPTNARGACCSPQ